MPNNSEQTLIIRICDHAAGSHTVGITVMGLFQARVPLMLSEVFLALGGRALEAGPSL